MARSVVLRPQPRCGRCQLPHRWCVCAGVRAIATPLQVDILMHHREQWRPSSTGHLVQRTIVGARTHIWRRERGMTADEVRVAGRELWILQPNGAPMPPAIAPETVQVLLIDGAWKEASTMAREIRAWGRPVRLAMAGESRYWLRSQQDGGRFSTVEALIFLLRTLGQTEAAEALQLQLELHVYAGLRARGSKTLAEEFLATSPIATAFPELVAQLNVSRPRVD
ncbi:MAG TPA: DTW domain-containing protein [Opitutus sp.]|nr:DTW domain-containing protein [Opitutus sp.]